MIFLPTFFLKVHLLCTNDDFEACLGIPMVLLRVHWTTVRGVHEHVATLCTKSNSVLTYLHRKIGMLLIQSLWFFMIHVQIVCGEALFNFSRVVLASFPPRPPLRV